MSDEEVLLELSDIDPSLQIRHSYDPALINREILLYASLALKCPRALCIGAEDYKQRLHEGLVPNLAYCHSKYSHWSRDLGGTYWTGWILPVVCSQCYRFMGSIEQGLVRERCLGCAGQKWNTLYSNILYESQQLMGLYPWDSIYCQLIAKYYSPNAPKEIKECQIVMPPLGLS